MPFFLIFQKHRVSWLFLTSDIKWLSHCYFNWHFPYYFRSCVFWLCGFALLWVIYSYLLSSFFFFYTGLLFVINCKISYILNISYLTVIGGINIFPNLLFVHLIEFHTKISTYYMIRLIFSFIPSGFPDLIRNFSPTSKSYT